MADQTSRWTSSRVAQARTNQQVTSSGGAGGTQQSRWASSSASTSSTGSSSTASSWRSRSNDTNSSSSSIWNKASTNTRPAAGASASRWATPNPTPPPPRTDDTISSLTNSLQTASLHDSSPSIKVSHTAPSPTQHTQQNEEPSPRRSDGLTVRNTTRPLGGKSLDRLSLLASPSRGLDSTSNLSTELSSQGNMDLTAPSVQSEFRGYITGRIRKALPLLSPAALTVLDSAKYLPSEKQKVGGVREGEEELQQVLLLVRKLREAVVASKREDGFAVEVYELSTVLAVLCADVMQLVASLPRLVMELHPRVPLQRGAGEGDVEALLVKLGLDPTAEGGEEGTERMASLYLLQSLCLSGRALRLGQYDTTPTDGLAVETLQRGLREYRSIRGTVNSLYGNKAGWRRHLKFCDAVHSALRGVDPFEFTALLHGEGGYEVDLWQKLILLQVVPTLRNAAWAVARRTYIYLPISEGLLGLVKEVKAGEEGGVKKVEQAWLEDLLMLGTELLPLSQAELEQVKAVESVRVREETPDDWDTSTCVDSQTKTSAQAVKDKRLHTFLLSHLSTNLSDRLMPLKDGSTALKIK